MNLINHTSMLDHKFPYFLPRQDLFLSDPDGVSFCPESHPQPLFFTPPSQCGHTPLSLIGKYATSTPTPPHSSPFQLPPPNLRQPAPASPVGVVLNEESKLANTLKVDLVHLQSGEDCCSAASMLQRASCSVNATAKMQLLESSSTMLRPKCCCV